MRFTKCLNWECERLYTPDSLRHSKQPVQNTNLSQNTTSTQCFDSISRLVGLNGPLQRLVRPRDLRGQSGQAGPEARDDVGHGRRVCRPPELGMDTRDNPGGTPLPLLAQEAQMRTECSDWITGDDFYDTHGQPRMSKE